MMRGWKRLLAKEVLAQLHSGKAFRGVVWERNGDFLVLRAATLYDPEVPDDPQPLDGEVMIHRAEVEYYQLIGG